MNSDLHLPASREQSAPITLRALQSRILQTLLYGAVVLGFLLLIVTTVQSAVTRDFALVGLGVGLLIAVGVVAFNRNLFSHSIRALVFLSILFLAGVLPYIDRGFNAFSLITLVVVPILALLLVDIFFAIAPSIICLISLIISSVSSIGGTPLITSQPGQFVSMLVLYMLSMAALMSTISQLLRRLEHSLTHQSTLAEQLYADRQDLETRLDAQTVELNRRLDEYEINAEMARMITLTSSPVEIQREALQIIHRRMGLYYAGILLVDERGEYAVLESAVGNSAVEIISQTYRQRLGEVGLIGYVINRKTERLVSDVTFDPFYAAHPLLPDTRSELVLPLIIGDEAIGALDLQSDRLAFFTPEIVKVLQLACAQLAGAIHTARILADTSMELDELRHTYQQMTRQSWSQHLSMTRRQYSYRMRDQEIQPAPADPIHMSSALQSGKPSITPSVDESTGQPFTIITLPITMRQQTLGVLEIRYDGSTVPQNLLELLEMTSSRLSPALENARLLEEIQLRAEREHLVSNITSRVRAATDIEAILETAASELGKSMGVAGVVVQLRNQEG